MALEIFYYVLKTLIIYAPLFSAVIGKPGFVIIQNPKIKIGAGYASVSVTTLIIKVKVFQDDDLDSLPGKWKNNRNHICQNSFELRIDERLENPNSDAIENRKLSTGKISVYYFFNTDFFRKK